MAGRRYLCVHGHFYQPPRENAWTEEIELQKSAAPFHDWNERIHHECYLPNTKARVLDGEGRISDIVNNFESMNFNFGPTLLSWLEVKHPETYRSILSADARSAQQHAGHGNAIAQVYNHIIMPLASRRDKKTQLRWGIEDFGYRFGRAPESVWLAETACNEETLELLVEEGMRYLILSPHQAEAVRPLNSGDWRDVSGGQIDPKQPYRCFLKKDPQAFIDIFFYDGPVSKAAGFEDLLFDARLFMARIESAVTQDRAEDQLIAIATDGETFGHHKAYGDRALAYLTGVEARQKGFETVNFGQYLDSHPPQTAVRLKEGENGEGTSWSCPHGVRRWKDHCGCRGGGPGHWTQHWRKPLREALDWLNSELAQVFESEGAKYFNDPWAARDGYVQVMLDRSEKSVERFLAKYTFRALVPEETARCLKLLEMQRHTMLMYTSCGWFFTELSGIETTQILQYACRAVELGEELSGRRIEPDFVARLAAARSNLAELNDGRGIWERYVKPSRTGTAKIVAHFAMLAVFEEFPEHFRMGAFRFDAHYRRKEAYANVLVHFGRVTVTCASTLEHEEYFFTALQFGNYDFRTSVRRASEIPDPESIERELFDSLHSGQVVELIRKIDGFFGQDYYDLKDMFLADRQKILSMLSREAIDKISATHEELYDKSRRMNEIYRSINLPIPEEIRYAVAHTLSKRLEAETHALAEQGFDARRLGPVLQVIESARKFDVELKKEGAGRILSDRLADRARQLAEDPAEPVIEEAVAILKLAEKIGLEPECRGAQDEVFGLLKKWRDYPETVSVVPRSVLEGVLRLAALIGINAKNYRPEAAEAVR